MTRAALLAAALAVLAACGGGNDDGNDAGASPLATRTVEAGEVTVEITPVRLDAGGAEFEISFDTHSVDLDLDVAGGARLTVAGAGWVQPTWEGAGPGGHHREGLLRFQPDGAVAGTAELVIRGLADPVTATWNLGGR